MIIGASLIDEANMILGNRRLFELSVDFMELIKFKLLKTRGRSILSSFYNEDYTSTLAQQCLYSYCIKNKIRNKSEDSLAAAIMLEEFIQSI